MGNGERSGVEGGRLARGRGGISENGGVRGWDGQGNKIRGRW